MVFIRSLLLLRFAQEWKGTDRFRGGRGPGSHRRRQRLHLQRLLLAAPSNLGWSPAQPEVIESPPSPTSCLRPPPHLPREPWSYPLASAENGTYRGGGEVQVPDHAYCPRRVGLLAEVRSEGPRWRLQQLRDGAPINGCCRTVASIHPRHNKHLWHDLTAAASGAYRWRGRIHARLTDARCNRWHSGCTGVLGVEMSLMALAPQPRPQ